MPNKIPPHSAIIGVILAGGLSRRMQGLNKSEALLSETSLIRHAYRRAAPQVSELLLNSNTPLSEGNMEFSAVINDSIKGFAGPLAGILSAMEWCEIHRPNARWLASFAVDTPFFPNDLISTFTTALKTVNANYVCASSHGRTHPIFALWPVGDTQALREALTTANLRKVQFWTQRYRTLEVDFTPLTTNHIDPFFNINTQDDLAQAEAYLKKSRI